MRLRALLCALLAVSFAATPAFADADPDAALERIRATRAPTRDLEALHRRILRPERIGPETSSGSIWVNDLVQRTFRQTPVELWFSSEHADWYVERGRDPGDLRAAAQFFETQAFPRVTALTGATWTPGTAGQQRLAIFHGRTPGVGGYVSANDLLPRNVFPFSNERLIIYISAQAGGGGYNETLAHELEHLAHATINPIQQGWIDEGLAEVVAALVTGNELPKARAFRSQPNVQLNAWTPTPSGARLHYDASSLFIRYLMERGGGPGALATLIASGSYGFETVARYAGAIGLAEDDRSLFLDWLVANGVDDESLAAGQFGYQGGGRRSASSGELSGLDASEQRSVAQFGAEYFELSPAARGDIAAAVEPSVSVGPTDSAGAYYWSVRGDNLDTRLTRQLDLTQTRQATLKFRTWFDLEPDYDSCYALASADGAIWTPLTGLWTTVGDAGGETFGPGFTGSSGGPAVWLDEEMDLTPYAGATAWLRFECITDQSYSGPGFAVDGIAVPEIGLYDDAELDRGWQVEGFARVGPQMTQPAVILLVEVTADEVRQRQVALATNGTGRLMVEPDTTVQRRFVLVSGLAPATLNPMLYRIWFDAT